jgi:hypothetical protein
MVSKLDAKMKGCHAMHGRTVEDLPDLAAIGEPRIGVVFVAQIDGQLSPLARLIEL